MKFKEMAEACSLKCESDIYQDHMRFRDVLCSHVPNPDPLEFGSTQELLDAIYTLQACGGECLIL